MGKCDKGIFEFNSRHNTELLTEIVSFGNAKTIFFGLNWKSLKYFLRSLNILALACVLDASLIHACECLLLRHEISHKEFLPKMAFSPDPCKHKFFALIFDESRVVHLKEC